MARKDKSSRQQHAPATTDARFARLHTDPRFLKPQREASKVTVDDRFKGLLDGNDFGINKRASKVDRFGRKTKKGAASKEEEEMRRLYRLEQEREAAGSEEEEAEATDEEDDEEEDSDEEDGEEKPFIDYARGAADLESSGESSSEEEDDEEESGSSDEDDDAEATVAIGNAAVLRKERRRQRAARGSGDDDDSDDSLSEDVDLEEIQNLDSKDLAVLDAQAALYNDQDEAGPSSRLASSSKSKQKRPKKDAIPMGDETKRLAVVNMDWDHVRSLDLYKVFSSLVSPLATRMPGPSIQEEEGSRKKASIQVRGTVESVRIYPSEFGRERMQREDREGPPKDIFKSESNGDSHSKKKKSSKKGKGKSRQEDDDSGDESDFAFEVNDGGEFDEEALRKYQLDRLRYFYAVATFDSAEAARHVYDEVDGTEMERTANLFDLRFVPDGMEFPEHQGDDGWRDEAKPGADDGIAYKGLDWATDALRHSKVKLTWDAPDPERQKITRRAASSMTKDQIRDEDFRAYLASDSEGEEDDALAEAEANGQRNAAGGGAGRDRFRSLLGLDDENNAFTSKKKNRSSAFEDAREDEDGGGDMQITFLPGLSEAAARKASGTKEDGEETTLEKYLRKQREKKAARKAGKTNAVDEDAEEAQPAVAAGNDDIGFDDPFFASGGEEEDIDFDAMLAKEGQQTKSSKTKNQKKKQSKTVAKEDSPVEPSLPLPDEAEDDGRHFDMKDILKAEAKQGKKLNRWERKKLLKAERAAARKNGEDGDPTIVAAKIKTKTPAAATQDDFKMDLTDSRFGALLNPEGDHEYALDPSHPSFLKTKNMKKLMEEKRKRSSAALLADEEELGGAKKRKAVVGGEEDGDAVAMLRDLKKRQVTTSGKNGSSKKGRRG